MKNYKLLLLFAVAIVLLGNQPVFSGTPQESEEDDYGKVIGQIVDPETGAAVKEAFSINIYNSKSDEYPGNLLKNVDTDNRGKFELDISPYTYYLEFYPKSSKSRYSHSPYPFYLPEKDRDAITVEIGKITYFKKKAGIGGILKLKIADMNNVPFNPREKFSQKFTIKSEINSDFYKGFDEGEDSLDDGVQTVYRLYEGIYRIRIEFEGLGFKNFNKDNIPVEKGKTTEVLINLDLNDITGIEGFVTDANGVPIEDLYIVLGVTEESQNGITGFVAFSNKDGYYRLKGLPEGKYHLSYIYSQKTGDHTIGGFYGYIDIKRNLFKHFDIQLKKTIAEMEKK